MKSDSEGRGLSKADLVSLFNSYRRQYLGRIILSSNRGDWAEDIFQDACVRFLASDAVFNQARAGTTYFCKILNNLIIEYHRKSSRLIYGETVPEPVHDPWKDHGKSQLMEQVFEKSQRLPVREQKLIEAFLNPKNGNGAADIPVSTRKYRLQKVIVKLRRMVEEPS